MDWQLSVFRLGMLLCVIGAFVAVTQFDIIDSAVAVWNHNPSTQEAAAANDAALEAKRTCLSAEKKSRIKEYPSGCYPADTAFKGLTRDKALANVERFLVFALILMTGTILVVMLGIRMARESRV
ncbi:MAG TPA: hypothetical protein VMJ73_06525 [Rhizomicrobium sp.]|nr:hypothetical protein [Rhizomicrobium sp.]